MVNRVGIERFIRIRKIYEIIPIILRRYKLLCIFVYDPEIYLYIADIPPYLFHGGLIFF